MNFLALIESAKTIISLYSVAMQFAHALDDAIPVGGAGKAKMDMLVAYMETTFSAGSAIAGSFSTLWPIVQNMVETSLTAVKTAKAALATVTPK